MTLAVLPRMVTRSAAARARLPNTRTVWLCQDLNHLIVAQMDWPSLMRFSRVDHHCRTLVLAEVKRRIMMLIGRFIAATLIEAFWDAVDAAGAGVVGGVVLHLLRLYHATFESELGAAHAEGVSHASAHTALDILVPDSGFETFRDFLCNSGYSVGWDIGIGTCYERAGICEFTVMVPNSETAPIGNEVYNNVICIYRCTQPILKTVMRSPWSIQTNLITADTVVSAFPHLTYDIVCLRNRRSHPLSGPGMRVPDAAFFEPFNGDWEDTCGRFCPKLKENRGKFFKGIASFTWDDTRRSASARRRYLAETRKCIGPNSFAIFCYNQSCVNGEEWILPWGGPRGRVLPSPFNVASS